MFYVPLFVILLLIPCLPLGLFLVDFACLLCGLVGCLFLVFCLCEIEDNLNKSLRMVEECSQSETLK